MVLEDANGPPIQQDGQRRQSQGLAFEADRAYPLQ